MNDTYNEKEHWIVGEPCSGSVIDAARLIGEYANGSYTLPGSSDEMDAMVAWLRWRIHCHWRENYFTKESRAFDESVRSMAIAALAYYDAREAEFAEWARKRGLFEEICSDPETSEAVAEALARTTLARSE